MKTINYEYRAYKNKIQSHEHNYGQLIIPITGVLNIETDELDSKLDRNKILFIPNKINHAYSASSSSEFLVLDIPKEFIKSSDNINQDASILINLDEKWNMIKELIIKECQSNSNPQSINNLFHYFYQNMIQEQSYASVRYINNHFNESISLKLLADIEGYTPNYYSEWFKKTIGLPVSEYIKTMRVKKSKELLLNSAYNLMQIAQLVGYNHHSSLTRAFKEIEGDTPAGYRKSKRKHG